MKIKIDGRIIQLFKVFLIINIILFSGGVMLYSQWTWIPPDIFYDGGFVGINTTNPIAELDVQGGGYLLGGNGDVNNDGIVDILDALRIAQYLGGYITLTKDEYARADINGDGHATYTDYMLIALYHVNLITLDEAHHGVGKHTVDSAFCIDPNGNIGIGLIAPKRELHVKSVMRLEPRDTAPTSPSAGDLYFDATTNKLMCYDGTIWQACW